MYFLDLKPPSQKELSEIAEEFVKHKNLTVEDSSLFYRLSSKCVGMSEDSFTQILSKAALDKEKNFSEVVIPMAEKTKKQFVDKSGLLKYVETKVNTDNVGGLEHLKWWLNQKKKAFENHEAAKEKGINPAKGILLVGMPGCGKSLASKAVANFFKLPLLSLDLGSLMGKYLGESEENLRRALRLAENSSPCVLWVDEIEKAFAGVGGDESGVSQRLFGYLLTWLNDKTARVFVMATANDVAVLPPEFLRRGRFDEIFYVDFPNAQERKDIFRIHLEKDGKGKKLDEILSNEENNKKFEELTRDKRPDETSSGTDTVVSDIERALKNREFFKKKLEEKLGKKELEKMLEDGYTARVIDELIRDKKGEDEGDGKKKEKPKDAKGYYGTEGYAGSDIEALVNTARERGWNQHEEESDINILDILIEERKHMTPLKEVLAEKIARNREKFGQYKLTPASDTDDNLRRFEIDSKSSDVTLRCTAAKNERCPAPILRKLVKDKNPEVKLALLDNPRLPPDCLADLMGDDDPGVKEKAKKLHGKNAKPAKCSECKHWETNGKKCEMGTSFPVCKGQFGEIR